MLSPFLPFSSDEVWEQLAFKDGIGKGGWDAAADLRVEAGRRINEPRPVFRKVEESDLSGVRVLLG